jgi:ribonuclease Z
MSEFEITFLGTSASVPTPQRNVAATLIQHEGLRILVDCGEGTQRQMMRFGGLKAPDFIFITHYHPDHDLGLPGLLATLKMAEHEDPIKVIGPPGMLGCEKLCVAAGGAPSFVEFIETDAGCYHHVSERLSVLPFNTDHDCRDRRSKRNSSFGYVFQEADRPGRFDVDKADALAVNPGPDYGRLQAGESVINRGGCEVKPSDVIGPPRPGRKVVITGDTRPCGYTVTAARNADLLIHEATFSDDDHSRAQKTGHSTGRQAAGMAFAAEVRQLALYHISPRTSVGALLNEVEQVWPLTLVAKDGDKISLPVKG